MDEDPTVTFVIAMFRNKYFDLTNTLSIISNALGQLRMHHVYAHRGNPPQILQRKDRETLRRIEFRREMAMAYAPREVIR